MSNQKTRDPRIDPRVGDRMRDMEGEYTIVEITGGVVVAMYDGEPATWPLVNHEEACGGDEVLYVAGSPPTIPHTGPAPTYATTGSAGADLRATEDVTIQPGQRALIPTGVRIALPEGFEAQVRPRSGLALRHGGTVLNAPGTIDSDYRGEVKVMLINLGDEPFTIKAGDRIAQLVIARYERVEWAQVETLDDTERGDGGFGSTGVE